MSLLIRPNLAVAAVDAVTSMIDTGDGDVAQLIVFSGTPPASVLDDVDVASEILVTFDLPSPSFGDAAIIGDNEAVEALAFTIPMTPSTGAGDATFFRVYDKDGLPVMQGDVDDTGVPTCLLNQKTITLGAEITVERLCVGMAIEG